MRSPRRISLKILWERSHAGAGKESDYEGVAEEKVCRGVAILYTYAAQGEQVAGEQVEDGG